MMTEEEMIVAILEVCEDHDVDGDLSFARSLVERLKDPSPRAHWQRWSNDQYDELATLFKGGVPIPEICERLGRTQGSVKGAIGRLGLTREG